jgi:hypothetical protein
MAKKAARPRLTTDDFSRALADTIAGKRSERGRGGPADQRDRYDHDVVETDASKLGAVGVRSFKTGRTCRRW